MDHPSPTSPGRRPRGFSFRSDKSGGSKGKVDHVTESPEDKARRDSIWKTGSKANPNAALSEAQPGMLNLTEQSTLQSIRSGQHKDVNGNVIVDPDLSNPTRPRLERPLDTIRSFEKAIDNGYKRRTSYVRSESYGGEQNNYAASRRSSYFGGEFMNSNNPRRRSVANALSAGNDSGPSPGRHSAMGGGGGYYGDRPASHYGGPGGPGPRQRYSSNRMASDSQMPYDGQRPYPPQHGHHQSNITVGTNGSDSTGPWANSTDPSSENSSIDKNMAAMAANGKQPAEPYGQNGYGPNGYGSQTIMEEGGAYGGPVQPPYAHQPPQQQRRAPIPLGNSGDAPLAPGKLPTTTRPEPEKKKSWLKRRFSKKE